MNTTKTQSDDGSTAWLGCPFCGSKDVGLSLDGKRRLHCNGCGCDGPEPQDYNNQGHIFATAVDAWNARAS